VNRVDYLITAPWRSFALFQSYSARADETPRGFGPMRKTVDAGLADQDWSAMAKVTLGQG